MVTDIVECDAYLTTWRRTIHKQILKYVPPANNSTQLAESAMRYAVDSGHRWRPLLLIASYELTTGKTGQDVIRAACAIELIHCCTIILDDLPFVDNAEFRRGRPTCHVIHGEAVTVYASHLLFDLAQRLASQNAVDLEIDPLLIQRHLSTLRTRLIEGQVTELNLKASTQVIDQSKLQHLYELKGSLFASAAWLSAAYGKIEKERAAYICKYGEYLGAAYQIADDIADKIGNARVLGKPVHRDSEKVNLVNCLGVNQAQEVLKDYWEKAVSCLKQLPHRTSWLEQLGLKLIALQAQPTKL